tara:strand:- start:1462 stop:1755 length:294 start_codon:yes stop_codon:yes gene_type:complete
MKVRREVSLTPDTYEISMRMQNFSQWVRIGLREHKTGNNLATETLRRIRFANAALTLAAEVIELRKMLEIETDEDPTIVMGNVLHEQEKQKTLEDFA